MAATTPDPRFQLYYWPIPFRGCFISYLFAYQQVPLRIEASFDAINALKDRDPLEQAVPFMGPPVLRDHATGQVLSQMPAIALYVSRLLKLSPDDAFDEALCMKVLMDCNDVLMEICRYNGSSMWEREDWVQFRSERLPRWLRIFEASLARGDLGGDPVSFADIGVFALFGNMMRCLPELEADVRTHAPGIHALCEKIGARPSLAAFVARQEHDYGKTYCGGYIEKSLRRMLFLDAAE